MTTPKKRPAPRSKSQLKEDLETLRETVAGQEELDPTSATVAAKRREEVARATANVTPEDLVTRMSTVTQLLAAAATDLGNIREEIDNAKKELAEIHGKETVAASIADLLEEHQLKTEEFEQLSLARTKEFDARCTDQLRMEAERKAAVEKERKREEDEYKYNLRAQRRAAEDEFSQKMQTLGRDFDEKMFEQAKQWKVREEALVAKETQYAAALMRIEGLPAEIAAAEKKASDSVARAISSEFKHQAEIAAASSASAKALADAEIKSLKEKVAASDMLVASMQVKLEAAEKRVESIANSALASASGRQALEASTAMASTLKDNGPARKG